MNLIDYLKTERYLGEYVVEGRDISNTPIRYEEFILKLSIEDIKNKIIRYKMSVPISSEMTKFPIVTVREK